MTNSNVGISKTMFVFGIILAIGVSSAISIFYPKLFPSQGSQGPQGDPGPQGPQGEPGPPGPMISIPHASVTWSFPITVPASYEFENIAEMSVTLTLEDDSHVVILYSMTCIVDPQGDTFYLRALIDGPITTLAEPGQPMFRLLQKNYIHTGDAISCHFYKDLPAGEYTISIQWKKVTAVGTLYSSQRALTAFVIPNSD